MAEIRAARFEGLAPFGLCLDGARITTDGFDSDGDLAVDEANDEATVAAIQQALLDLGFPVAVTGEYGPDTAEVVREFKVQQDLPVPDGLAEHDGVTGPGTSGRLDEIFSAFAVLRLCNEYGEALPGVSVDLAGSDGVVRPVVTDGAGAVLVDVGGPWDVTLEPESTRAALGDLFDRPWPPDPPPAVLELPPENLTATTAFTDVPVGLAVGADLTVIVGARLLLDASLPQPLPGDIRIEGDGVRVAFDDETVMVQLQANGGVVTSVFLDTMLTGDVPPPLTEPTGWSLPDGYIVRDGDTAEGLAELFLHDPARFAELSDHDPVPGETITLPAEAVPGWLAMFTDPGPDLPQTQLWFEVVPDDLLRVLYADAEPSPLQQLLAALVDPPSPGPDPVAQLMARGEVLALILASPEVHGPAPTPVDPQVLG